ncbi:MAG: nonstructural protein [Microvirus sp.]|nr:MAG: nonstructural protein [Microvirus sp.]
MIVQVFCVYDSKAGAYGQPYFCLNEQIAIRAMRTTCNDPDSMLCKYPADFNLFHLGHFDDHTGAFTQFAAPISLGLALNFKGQENADA